MFILTGLTFKVLVFDSNGGDRCSIKIMLTFSHLWTTSSRVAINMSEVAKEGWISLWFDGRLHQIEIFRFSTMGVFKATNNALVELLKRTKIQVCISIIFNVYSMTFNILSLSTLNISFSSLDTDVFSSILRHGIATLSLFYEIASKPIITFTRTTSCNKYPSIEYGAKWSNN